MSGPDPELASAVRRLLDDADVAQVIMHYADGLDRREFERVTALFAPDAFVRGLNFSGPVSEYLPQLYDGVRSFGATQHLIGNQLRRVDADIAHTESYCIARHFEAADDGHNSITVGVRYVDDLQRDGDAGWLIARREIETMWRRVGDAVPPR